MPKRIQEDWNRFRNLIKDRQKKSIKDLIDSGQIVKLRPKGGKMIINVPKINIPHFTHGQQDTGVGRGQGKPGDKIGEEKGKDKKGGAGSETAQGIEVSVDLNEIINQFQEDLELPDLKPKPSQIFEDVQIKYNNISKIGPRSLRHPRRTIQQALKRSCATGDADKLIEMPGFNQPIDVIDIHNDDQRFRQYKEIHIPANNAVIFFARDWSGSMDSYRCDIINDMSWWIDLFIRKFYKKVERVYVGHDAVAEECDENKFYKYRIGGGTKCSTAFKFISDQFVNRFIPSMWNIYVFYFTDGDNWDEDNEYLISEVKTNFNSSIVNMMGLTQTLPYRYRGSVKETIEEAVKDNSEFKNIRAVSIGNEPDSNDIISQSFGMSTMTDEARNLAIKRAIAYLLGSKKKKKSFMG